MGNLGIFDASQTASATKTETVKTEDPDSDADDPDSEPAITSFKLHTRTIGAFHFSPADSNHLYTASYDSSIRKLDLAASRAVEIYAPTSPDLDEPLSGVEIASTDPHTLYFSRLDGCFGRHDTRAAPHSTDVYQLSDKKIGGFSLHPRLPHLVATASLDRYMRLWDLRKISGRGEGRAPALVGEHESCLSVSHAAFNAAGQVATASYDDTIKIHSCPDAGSWAVGQELNEAEMKPSTTIKHNNQTGRWVTMLVSLASPLSSLLIFTPPIATPTPSKPPYKTDQRTTTQSPPTMASQPVRRRAEVRHRQHEPLRRHLHGHGPAARSAR